MAARWVAWSERRGRAVPPQTFATKAEATAAYASALQAAFDRAGTDTVYMSPRGGSDCIAVCIDGGSDEVNEKIARLVAEGKRGPPP